MKLFILSKKVRSLIPTEVIKTSVLDSPRTNEFLVDFVASFKNRYLVNNQLDSSILSSSLEVVLEGTIASVFKDPRIDIQSAESLIVATRREENIWFMVLDTTVLADWSLEYIVP